MDKSILISKAQLVEEIRRSVSNGERISIYASGNSMNPLIVHKRDQIDLGPYKDEDLRNGAVVLAKDQRGEYVIHRIVDRNGEQITLMGDGNLQFKETASVNDVIAIMYSITRKGKIWTSDSKKWRAYSWIWQTLTPIRRLPLGIWRRISGHRAL